MEIERKFLLWESGASYITYLFYQTPSLGNPAKLQRRVLSEGNNIQQGYLPLQIGMQLLKKINVQINFDPVEARLRLEEIKPDENRYVFTLKGKGDLSRPESNSIIDEGTFSENWEHTSGKRIIKKRLTLPILDHNMEFDTYKDRGLFTAEVEFASEEQAAQFPMIGLDITNNPAYKNRNLAR